MERAKNSSPSPLAVVGIIAIVLCVVFFGGCALCVCVGAIGNR
jgi:hypothetical protein